MTEPAPVPTESSEDLRAKSFRRNYRLGILNGMFVGVGNRIISPQIVLAEFVYGLTQSTFLVSLLPSLGMASRLLPQLYIGSLIEERARRKIFYVAATVVRVVLLFALAATMLLAKTRLGTWAVVLFFLVYCAFRAAQGGASIPFMDILAGTVGPSRVGGLFARRHFLGTGLSLLCAFLLVQPIVDRVPAPTSYAVLTIIAMVLMAIGWGIFCLVEEKPLARPPRRRTVRQSLAAGARLLREDSNYRGLFWLRVLARLNGLTLVFCIPYAVEKLGAVALSGILLGFMQASRLISSLVLGSVSDRKGNRSCLLLAAVFFIVSPLVGLAAARMPEAFRWAVPGTKVVLDLPLATFFLAIGLFGFAQQANIIGLIGFTLETAPRARRPSYLAFLNTATLPAAFIPALFGALAAWGLIELSFMFVIAAGSGILTLLVTLRLTEVRGNGPS